MSKIPLYKMFNYVLYRLHTGCQWESLPVCKSAAEREARGEPSWQAVYYHYRKWSADGSLARI